MDHMVDDETYDEYLIFLVLLSGLNLDFDQKKRLQYEKGKI
jgi:hypothetical protein